MRFIALAAMLVMVTPAVLSAQGLAAVAKKEEERRKAVKASGKVYTNEQLKADITPSMPGTPGSSATNASPDAPDAAQEPSGSQPAVDTPASGGEVKDEKYWRTRISDARSALERSRIFGEALQSRINALNRDVVNRDDPAQRTQLELERQRALAELERVKKEIAANEKAISDIEEEARRAGVPPGWLR